MVPSIPTTASPVPLSLTSLCDAAEDGAVVGIPSPVDLAFLRERSRVEQVRRIGTAWLKNVCRVPSVRVEAAEVLISELVTNAVLHGRGEAVGFRMRVTGGRVRLEVNDHSPSAVPEPGRVGPDSESGRGLWLVDVLVDELGGTWGFTADGTTAWCVFPVVPQFSDVGHEGRSRSQDHSLGSKRRRQ
ncbi:ATP-binding protein [Streptomyces sp. NPDC052101]|uniref:ATP-binding protein n=1 Tax=Streptomyces sp. NPDC052101 TaxID=3155763 RepID=UPI00341F3673